MIDRSNSLLRAAAYGLSIIAAFLGAVAVAQATTPLPPPDLTPYFRDGAGLSALVVVIVAFIRARVPALAGNQVILLSGITGAALGLIGGLLGITPGGPVGGALLGVSAALFGSGVWDAGASLATKAGEANARAQIKAALTLDATDRPTAAAIAAPVAFAGVGPVNPQTLTDYLLDLIRARFGSSVPAFAWTILATLTREFVGQALNEQTRAAIQRRLLDLLATAGAEGQDV